MKKIAIALSTTVLGLTATAPIEISAKDTLSTLTASVEVAEEALANLEQKKTELEQKYIDTIQKMSDVIDSYDITDKDKLVSETEAFLSEETAKAQTLMEYEGYATNIEQAKADNEKAINELNTQIEDTKKDIESVKYDLMVHQEELNNLYMMNEHLQDEDRDETNYNLGMRGFVAYINPDKEWKEEYAEYTPEEVKRIFEGYKGLEAKLPLSLEAILTKKEADVSGDAFGAVFQEDGTIFYGYTTMAEDDPKDLDKVYDEYLKHISEIKDRLDNIKGFREVKKNIAEKTAQQAELESKLKGFEESQTEHINKRSVLDNIDIEITNLKEQMASDEEVEEATYIHDKLKEATVETLLTEDGYDLIETVKSRFGDRYNLLIANGKDLARQNKDLMESYQTYGSQLKIVDKQIESAQKTLQEAKDKLEKYKNSILPPQTPAKEEDVENKETGEDKGKLETGISGVNIIIPAIIGAVGIGGVVIGNSLKHKKKRR